MKFHVRTLRRANSDCDRILTYIAERSRAGAVAWARAYDAALVRLEQAADALPLAAEDDHVDFEVREVLFKTRRGGIYRALFTIRGDEVLVLHVRGPGQDFLSPEELEP